MPVAAVHAALVRIQTAGIVALALDLANIALDGRLDDDGIAAFLVVVVAAALEVLATVEPPSIVTFLLSFPPRVPHMV
eukprot:6601407-Pyramimonas_sp.AAC.1